MRWFWTIVFWLAVVLIVLFIAMPFTEEGRERIALHKAKYIIACVVWIGVAAYVHNGPLEKAKLQHQRQEQVMNRPNLLGHKINKYKAKKDSSGFYYTDKDDPKIKYFVNDKNKITAVKYDYRPNYQVGTNAVGHMKDIINDNNIKFGSEKQSANRELLPENHYNIYSPKYKKWYHTSIQRESKDHITVFTVWQGKSDSTDVDNIED